MEAIEKFLNNLYSYEYFGLYLLISIIVLVILFIIILFFGKKDQKIREIEATKKLQQINNDAFKEDSISENLQINNEPLDNTIVVPRIEDIPVINNVEENNEIPEPIIPMENNINISETVSNNINKNSEQIMSIEENTNKEKIEQIKEENDFEPILDPIEEKPLAIDNTNIFNSKFSDEVIKMENEEIKPVIEEVEVPEFNFDEVIKEVEEVKQTENYNRGPQIFSSVYVPEQKEEPAIEMPKLEIPTQVVEEEMDFELPTLKKEDEKIEEPVKEKIEVPILNDYNLDNLSGETYTINK